MNQEKLKAQMDIACKRKEKDEGSKPSGFSISRDSVADLITTPTLSALIGRMGIKYWPPIVRIV